MKAAFAAYQQPEARSPQMAGSKSRGEMRSAFTPLNANSPAGRAPGKPVTPDKLSLLMTQWNDRMTTVCVTFEPLH